jgi:hypothetical protein
LPWGKFRGALIAEVPSTYLVWLLEESDIDESYCLAIRQLLARRLGLQRSPAPPSRGPMLPPGELAPAFRAMLEAGYRTLALQHHPDRGGDVEAMKRVNAARDWARAWQWL